MKSNNNAVQSEIERFGQRLRFIRQARKMSLAELGELSQTNLNQISRYERAAVVPTIDIVFRIAKALGVSVGELLDSGQPTVSPESREIFQRLTEVEQLPPEDREIVKRLMDAFLTSQRVKEVAAKAS